MNYDYVELHCHSAFSFLDGASSPDQLITQARRLGYDTLALTDHDGLYGSMEFAQAAHASEIRPITGAEVTLEGGYHLTLLAQDRRGYGNLCRLLSVAHLDSPKGQPRVTFDTLALYRAGLIALSGCKHGEIAQFVDHGRYHEAEAAARRYQAIFGPENYVLELQQNLVYGDTQRIRRLVELAEYIGAAYVATNDVHYHDRARHQLQDVLVAIRHRTTLDRCHQQRRENSEYFLKPPQEMAELFSRYPRAILNSRRIAERCEFDLAVDLGYTFPNYGVPEGYTQDSYLRKICDDGARDRYYLLGPRRDVQERLDEELRLVQYHHLAGFFLRLWDIIQFAHQHHYPARGRGSAVSSIVCYLLGLSHIDPMVYSLKVGRFLNEELRSFPDIDIDFSREGREKIIEHVYATYGRDNTALVSTLVTYRAKSAVRDVGKALGIQETDLARLADHLAHSSVDDLPGMLHRLPQFQQRAALPVWRHLVELTKQIAGLPRHLSQHVGGMIITTEPLVELVPLEPARMPGRVVCQWDKDSCADAKFIKLDFLALGMLSAVERTLDLVEARHGKRADLSRIDMNDAAVFDMIDRADTIGVFQIESRAQQQVLPRTRPRTLDDLTVQVALIRPGPGVSRGVQAYLEASAAGTWTFDHPLLEQPLGDTKGVIIYQDQVIEVAQALAGFTIGQGEILRRAMSRKRSLAAMQDLREQFLEGAAKKQVSQEIAERVFTKLTGFANFGFPRSHAAAFGALAYQTAWLRYYYPAEFTVSLINEQPMGFYSTEVVLGDAKRHGVDFLGPDINLSGAEWCLEGDALRPGLASVQEVSTAMARRITAEQGLRGPYRSLFDFWQRTRLRREPIENLIAVGAFDFLGLNRRKLQWQLGLFYQPLQEQLPLPLSVDQDQVPLAPSSPWERMATDYALLGFSAVAHPMQFARRVLGEDTAVSLQVAKMEDTRPVRTAGMVVCRQQPSTAHGFVFITLEDEFGLTNVVINPAVAKRALSIIHTEPFIIVTGEVQQRGGTTNVIAQRLVPLHLPRQMQAPPAHNFG